MYCGFEHWSKQKKANQEQQVREIEGYSNTEDLRMLYNQTNE